MRLLDTRSLEVVDVADDSVPEYAVLSHTWGPGEVTFQDLGQLTVGWSSPHEEVRNRVKSNGRLAKVVGATSLAAQNGYRYIWMDTCCIDKSSSAELSEAINSMYRWYEQAAVCYVYLSDVTPVRQEDSENPEASELELSKFQHSRWFTRGWTLQELIAPNDVRFFAKDWSFIGTHKDNVSFRQILSRITGIDDQVLAGKLSPQDLSVSTRMKWAALRQTSRTEDMAYCLMGIFSVNMPLLYGEGKKAFIRLQDEILRETDDQSLFAWTSVVEEAQPVDRLCGLLAESPLAFKDVGSIRPLPPLTNRDSVPSSITNQGLRIQLYLAPVGKEDQDSVEEEYHAILDCSERYEHREHCPTIHLRRLWGDQFARVRPHDCVLLPPPTDELPDDSQGYQTIFVKQKPVYIMPEFTLSKRDARIDVTMGEGEDYVLQEAYPLDRWDSSSLSLKSVYSQVDRVMGVFRFCHPLIRDIQVDVAVGLRRVNQKRWESWCLQQRCRRDSPGAIFDFFDQKLKDFNKLKNLTSASEFQTVFEKDQMIGSLAKVTETQIHGRRYITLHVVGKPEICTMKELSSLPATFITPSPIITRLEDEVRRMMTACYVADVPELSIFPTTELTTRVRTCPSGPSINVCIDLLKKSISSINQLRLRHPSSGELSRTVQSSSVGLLYACKDRDIGQATRLIRKREALIEAETENFHSFRPLHWATIAGDILVVRLLLSAGAEASSCTSENMTAVHLAAMMGHFDILKLFFNEAVAAGVLIDDLLDVKMKGTLESPYHLAAAFAPRKNAELFFSALYEYQGAYASGAGGSGGRDVTINSANYLDETPLHRAAAMNNEAAVKQIIKQQYNQEAVQVTDQFGRSPLWHAACAGSSGALRILAENGALLELSDDLGRTPLSAACRGGQTATVKALLESKANPNSAAQPLGLTPCHYAALFGHHACITLLINHLAKADASTTQWVYFKPIHLAAANGWLECVKELCRVGCDPDSFSTHYILLQADGDDIGLIARPTQSAAEIAHLEGHQHIVQFFRERKEEIEIRNQQPLHSG